jgi:hypothetical protein
MQRIWRRHEADVVAAGTNQDRLLAGGSRRPPCTKLTSRLGRFGLIDCPAVSHDVS